MSAADPIAGSGAAPPLLRMADVHKHFGGVAALRGASLAVRAGEVHALIGQNGAGKSTLIKVLTGVHPLEPAQGDRGTVVFDGQPLALASPQAAAQVGIRTVYQELNLVGPLSVAENLFLGFEPRRFGPLIDWPRVRRDARALLDGLGVAVDERATVATLSAAEQQLVAIARVVSGGARLVVLDESTSSLDAREVELLFAIVRRLRDAGRAVLFVSHRLEELYALCDRVTVMRDGRTVRIAPMTEVSRLELVTTMLGRELPQAVATTPARPAAESPAGAGASSSGGAAAVAPAANAAAAPLLEIEDLAAPPRVGGVSFGVRAGQTLGLAGLLGAGRTETLRLLVGADRASAGRIRLAGQPLAPKSPGDALAAGIVYLAEDRKADGIFPGLSVRENLTLALLPRLARRGVVDRAAQDALVERFVARLGIKLASADQPIEQLSGGNQQKVLLARWLALAPRVLLLDEPTRGVDVGAKADIAGVIDELAASGMAIVITTSELAELVQLADAAVVLRDGRSVARLEGQALNEGALMVAMAAHVD